MNFDLLLNLLIFSNSPTIMYGKYTLISIFCLILSPRDDVLNCVCNVYTYKQNYCFWIEIYVLPYI